MGKCEGLSETEKGKVLAFEEAGWSHRAIAKNLGRSRDVVQRFLRDPDNYGDNYRRVRPKKLSSRGMRALFREASVGDRSSTQLQQRLNTLFQPKKDPKEEQENVVGASTIRRYLHDSQLFEYKKRKKVPKLNDRHKAARLAWAAQYVDYGERWDAVIFSDEKKFNLDGPDGCQYYWHDVRHERDDFFSRQCGGGSLMIWAGMSARGVSKVAFLDGRQDANKYVYTLSEYLLPFGHLHYGTDFVFQHDNASIHTAATSTIFLDEMAVPTMWWPACSPNLNPIENLWGWLVKRVYANGKQYASVAELKRSVQSEWDQIPQLLLLNLVNNMKRRCISVIAAQGSSTKY